MSFGRPRSPVREPVLPTGDQIACYPTYAQAQQAIDFLAGQNFGIEQLAIVGTDLRSVERVTGRLSYGRVAIAGAMSGAWFGLFVGLLLSLFGGSGITSGITFIAIGLGAGFGLLFSVLSYALTRGKREFTSQSQTVAGSYAILCAANTAMAARQLLLNSPIGIGDARGILAPARPLPGLPVAAPPIPLGPVNIEQYGSVGPPPTTTGPGAIVQGAPNPTGQVVIIENPTVSSASLAQTEVKEPDSRWTLPNGMPRYGALASEEAVQAALANQAATAGPTPVSESGAVAAAVIPIDPNQSAS